MKLSDFIFKFKRRSGFASLGLCRVRLFANGEHVVPSRIFRKLIHT